ncbi:phosphatase PAP2 family protein [Bacillus sp. V5-8f]|uniref:phosphatase PAP2 family protein n=1 Tax=Bacillus sp. V5-8f TaxID=2053044 RepID=UPI000C75F2D9|nr:phosphatase PAP2 family protein [Bacillus sp. V5-8f]PLT32179.1 phosphoesterase [Bacillus sp. V5-8f]
MFDKKTNRVRDLLGLLVFPILGLIYGWLNNSHQDAVTLSTSFDNSIPFLPVFIIPYISWYGYIVFYLLYFWQKSTALYWKTISLITVGEVLCFCIYYFFQTTVPRPELSGDGLLIQLVYFIYTNDQPFNCFPSIHVLTTSAIMLSILNLENTSVRQQFICYFIGALIILSTLFVKQHIIYDVVASIIVSISLNSFLPSLKKPMLRVERKTQKEYQTF